MIKECLGYRVRRCLRREQKGVLERCSEVTALGEDLGWVSNTHMVFTTACNSSFK